MQIGKNMVKTPKLVYVLILFLSIFLSMIVSNSSFLGTFISSCKRDKDCPKLYGANFRCRKGTCVPPI
ncbi:putative Late nodulin [Medicago truncatula]|uniref:Putative Late nodulin n=1 Tax=Medicago truncatula TaxID=3880 RepID=I3T7D4_MEDTR|nr:unknown [Medicago truncatula]RHN58944.1 putative Late nodulin [Medicago truncatula]